MAPSARNGPTAKHRPKDSQLKCFSTRALLSSIRVTRWGERTEAKMLFATKMAVDG